MGTIERFTGIDKRHQKKNGISAAFLIFRCRISYSAKAAGPYKTSRRSPARLRICRRNWLGVTPVNSLNTRPKYVRLS